ncbi:MAG: hypothetical protein OXG37_02065 [Actinomycetia bacterium]|nr:hypothetical protein [Actinomycetes bacterium]
MSRYWAVIIRWLAAAGAHETTAPPAHEHEPAIAGSPAGGRSTS